MTNPKKEKQESKELTTENFPDLKDLHLLVHPQKRKVIRIEVRPERISERQNMGKI